MKKFNGFSFLVIALLVVLVSGCAPALIAPTNTAVPPTPTIPPPTFTVDPTSTSVTTTNEPSPPTLSLDWLLTADELTSISEGIGVFQWELIETKSDEYRVCHYFEGHSDSFNPNQAINCVYGIASGSTFDDVVSRVQKAKLLYPDEVLLPTSLTFEDDFAIFGGTSPNGQLVYDFLLYKGDLLYWVTVTIGRYSMESVEDIYKNYTYKTIDPFLIDAITINLEKSK